jgi:predicted transcriptional regulator
MKTATTVRLSDEAIRILDKESARQGVTRTAIFEMALRVYARSLAKAKAK